MKILNVMDTLNKCVALGDGIYQSGDWHHPDRDCEAICVFAASDTESKLGGPIIEVRNTMPGSNHAKVFVFRDDPALHGLPRPKFGANGCVASNL